MNRILVARFSENPGINPILQQALAKHYEYGNGFMYPVPNGGILSVLLTESTFEEVLQTVTECECGDPVQVTDINDVVAGIGAKTVIVPVPIQVGVASEQSISARIEALMQKQRTQPLTESEATELTALLASPPRSN